ncbi:hypothetical protein SFC12_02235 [Lactococcus lactis]|uniref:hypothetical protein n=1 Tax=Lactococcus lactis TaxID=1358 RepID=UPI003982A37F
MTQETAKSKIKNFKNQITEKFNVGEANEFRTYIGKLSPANVLDMLDDIERSITTDKLSVEKLQEELNSKVKALTKIRANIEEHNQIYDLDTNTALLLEGIDGIAFDALAAIGGREDE